MSTRAAWSSRGVDVPKLAILAVLALGGLGMPLVAAPSAQAQGEDLQPPPSVGFVQPGTGPVTGGRTVKIYGDGFTGATAVKFGDTPARSFNVDLDYEITAVTPAHAEETVHVSVTTPLGTSLPQDCGDSFYAALPNTRADCSRFHFYAEPRGGIWGTAASPGSENGEVTLLSDGKVLVTGGCIRSTNECAPTAQTKLYDPANDRWSGCPSDAASATCPAPMSVARSGHTATLLKDGRVLVAGLGRSAELYDPATGKWTPTGDRAFATDERGGWLGWLTATLLGDGRVLLLSGSGGDPRTAELYDPDTGSWTVTGTPADAVHCCWTATLLDTGNLLTLGGRPADLDNTTKAELYRPTERPGTGVWTLTGPPAHRRFGHTATLLSSGEVLVAGGVFADGAVTFSSAELYDPATGTWRETGRLGESRSDHTAVRLANGKVLVAAGQGGYNAPEAAEVYDPTTGRWTYAAFMPSLSNNVRSPTPLPSGPRAVCGRSCGKVLFSSDPTPPQYETAAWLLFAPAPEVAALNPAGGPSSGGTSITITGTGLASVNSVKFGGVEAQSLSADPETPDRKISAVSPAQPTGEVEVTVTTDGGTARAGSFTYLPGTDGGGSGTAPGPGSGGGDVGIVPGTGGAQPTPAGPGSAVQLTAREARRMRALRSCLARAGTHTRRERRLAHRGSLAGRVVARRHLRRHRTRMRLRCLARHGRTPGRVVGLSARAASKTRVVLSFRAPGTNRARGPAARGYLVKQSTRPIRGRRGFRRAQTLCKGSCRFPVTRVGSQIKLTVTDLRPRTTYYYAIAARDNVSRRLGARSQTVRVRTK